MCWAFDDTGKCLWQGLSGTVTNAMIQGWVGGGSSNNPPLADAGSDQNVLDGVTVNLNASGSSDPDSDPLTYAWTQIGGATVSLSGASTVNASFVAPMVGSVATYTFRIAVDDGNGGSDTDTVTITVTPSNYAPVAVAGPDAAAAFGVLVTLNGTGSSDPDADPITYSWSQVSGSTVGLTGATTATPSFTAPGADDTLIFELTVSDGNFFDTDTITIYVNAAGEMPGQSGSDDSGGSGCTASTTGIHTMLLALLAGVFGLTILRPRQTV
jgi:hypothetical protein